MVEDYVFHSKVRKISDSIKSLKPGMDYEVALALIEKTTKDIKDLIDEGFLEGERRKMDRRKATEMTKTSNVHIFWMCLVMIILLFSIGVFMGIGYMAIADLENCTYKGMCVETPRGGK